MDRRTPFILLLAVCSRSLYAQPPQTSPPASPTASGSSTQTQPTDTKKDDASLRDVVGSRQARPAEPPDIQPTKPVQPSPAPQRPRQKLGPLAGLPPEVGLPGRRFYAEGTFLSRRKGSLFRSPSGDVIFLPQRDSNKRGEAPMVIMACQELARLEAVPDAFSKDVVVTISGSIYVYYDRQYLMPSAYSVERALQANSSPAVPSTMDGNSTSTAPEPKTAAAPAPNPASAADPDVADLIKDLESKRGTSRAIDPPSEMKPQSIASGARPSEPVSPTDSASSTTGNLAAGAVGSVIPEGTTLFGRRARLVRLTGGLLAAAFDGDTTNPAPAPMPFLRCKMTQKLDEAARSRGEDLSLTVSGRVTVYDGRNYLLPSLVQVATNGDIRPQQ